MIQHTPETIQSLLGARVRMLRKSKKLSQDKLAKMAGVQSSTIGNIESGAGTQMHVFLRVLEALGALSAMSTVLLEETKPAPAISVTSRATSTPHSMGAGRGWGHPATAAAR